MSRAPMYTPQSMTAEPTFAAKATPTPVPVDVLLDILRRPRFADSEGESYVIDKYLLPLPGARQDAFGNIWVVVLDGEQPLTTMFSSHTDTAHKAKATGTYKLSLQGAWLSTAGGGVLGADCGTGIWIMLNLIKAEVPGIYVFHREEEIGGGGSVHIATNHAHLLTGIKHCIAFDRKDISHVITHQGGSRCCSEEFASAFSAQLNMGSGMEFSGNSGGSFTDSANYTHLIPECTNLSVGYYDQHSKIECQDLSFAAALVVKLINIDFSQLPAARDPAEIDEEDWNWAGYTYPTDRGTSLFSKKPPRQVVRHDFTLMTEMIRLYPSEIADMLEQMGYDTDGIIVELEDTYGEDMSAFRTGWEPA